LDLWPTQTPIQVKPGAFSLGVKRPECEVNHSSPSSADVKNKWTYITAPPVGVHDVDRKKFSLLVQRFIDIGETLWVIMLI